jgi:RNA-directed DNA polymerase
MPFVAPQSPPRTLVLTAAPDVLKQRFLALTSISELAALLEISEKELNGYTYGRRIRYRTFTIRKRKRHNGVREISEPIGGLKIIQQKLNQVLRAVYEPRPYVHGFALGRSIGTNAQEHAGKKWILNVDLLDFFPSINFGRVRGLFIAAPYALPENVATVLAQLCCYNRKLPQGAPTSPIISNMVAARLDSKLQRLARRHRCHYTRYADDITISSDRDTFPSGLGSPTHGLNSPSVSLSPELISVIEGNGFKINPSKSRLIRSDRRQEVTGLTVNHMPNVQRRYVRRIRAMLHAWEKYGYDDAERVFFERWDTKDRGPHSRATFKNVVKGHIDFLAMVRGNDDHIYKLFLEKYARLAVDFRMRPAVKRRRNHLQSYRDAVWLVVCWGGYNQGTAFELEGVGLVTCAHVLAKNKTGETAKDIVVTQPREGMPKFKATVVHFDKVRDLAILASEARSGVVLKPKFSPDPNPKKRPRVRAVGFPEHGPGHTIWEDEGHVTAYWHHIGSPRYIVNLRIAGGASGGPVFDDSDSVIGVISHGEESIERAMQGVRPKFGMIPLRLLQESLSEANSVNPGLLQQLKDLIARHRRRWKRRGT